MLTRSMRPDITENIPAPLSAQGERAATYSADRRFDFNVNGLGFNLWADPSHPYQRASESIQKEQFDTSREAGEQTLGGAWIRSQTSWHGGAGIDFYEPGLEEATKYRFHSSAGVDVWTPGKVTLLPAVSAAVTSLAAPSFVAPVFQGSESYLLAAGTSVTHRDSVGAVLDTRTLPGAATGRPAVSPGGVAYVGCSGRVAAYNFGAPAAPTTLRTTTGDAGAWWVKSRLLAAAGRSLYWVDTTVTSGTLGSVTEDVLITTRPDTAWQWVSVAEATDSILLIGHDGVQSRVYSVTVTESEGIPEFSAPTEALQLPPGELVTGAGTYLGAYLVLTTSKGVRVGVLAGQGAVQIGAITVERPAQAVAFYDRFAYIATTAGLDDGTTGLLRIDLTAAAEDIDAYGWASDVTSGGGADAHDVAVLPSSGTVLFTAGSSMYAPTGAFVTSGWLRTGRIRYATAEKKDFQRIAVGGVLNDGSVNIDAHVGANTVRVYSYSRATGLEQEVDLSVGSTTLFQDMAFTLTLNRESGALGPEVQAMTVKANPAVPRTRLVRIPLQCGDYETNRSGQRQGYRGPDGTFGFDRLAELETLEDRGEPVVVQDHRTGTAFVATIVSVEFTSHYNPDRSNDNVGGWLDLTVRRR